MVFVQVLAESVQGRSCGTSCDIIYMHVRGCQLPYMKCPVCTEKEDRGPKN
jgi:hypothetical protein